MLRSQKCAVTFVYVVWLYLCGHGGFTGHMPSGGQTDKHGNPLYQIILLSEVCEGLHGGPFQADVLSSLVSYATNIPNIMSMHEIFFNKLDGNLSLIIP